MYSEINHYLCSKMFNKPQQHMKKLVIAMLMCAATVAAQDQQSRFYHHELSSSISLGASTADKNVSDISSQYVNRYQLSHSDGCFDLLGDKHVFLNFEYHYRFNKTFALGGIFGWGYSTEQYDGFEDQDESTYLAKSGKENSRIFYLAPSFRYTWCHFDRYKCNLYSRVALGALRQHMRFDYGESLVDNSARSDDDIEKIPDLSYNEVDWKFTYQLTIVGLDIASHVYTELGYGCKGVWTIVGYRVLF